MVGLEVANDILSYTLCADPMIPLGATLAIFKAPLNSLSAVPKDRKQVAKAGDKFAKWLATTATLVDKRTPTVVALCNAIQWGE